jgi:hypothetical protein
MMFFFGEDLFDLRLFFGDDGTDALNPLKVNELTELF